MQILSSLVICSCAVLVLSAPDHLRHSRDHSHHHGHHREKPDDFQSMDPEVQRAIERAMKESRSASYQRGYGGYHASSQYTDLNPHDDDDDVGQQTEDLGQQIEDLGQQIQSSGYHSHGSRYSSHSHFGDQEDEDLGQQREVFGHNSDSSSSGSRHNSHVRTGHGESELHKELGEEMQESTGYQSQISQGSGVQSGPARYPGLSSHMYLRIPNEYALSQSHDSAGHQVQSSGHQSSGYGSSGHRTNVPTSGDLGQQKEHSLDSPRYNSGVNGGSSYGGYSNDNQAQSRGHGTYGSSAASYTPNTRYTHGEDQGQRNVGSGYGGYNHGNVGQAYSRGTYGTNGASYAPNTRNTYEEDLGQRPQYTGYRSGYVLHGDSRYASGNPENTRRTYHRSKPSVYTTSSTTTTQDDNEEEDIGQQVQGAVTTGMTESEHSYSSQSHSDRETMHNLSQRKNVTQNNDADLGQVTQEIGQTTTFTNKPLSTGSQVIEQADVMPEVDTDDFEIHNNNNESAETAEKRLSDLLKLSGQTSDKTASESTGAQQLESHSTNGGTSYNSQSSISEVQKLVPAISNDEKTNVHTVTITNDDQSGSSTNYRRYGMNYPHKEETEHQIDTDSYVAGSIGSSNMYPIHHTREFHMRPMEHTREFHMHPGHHTREYHMGPDQHHMHPHEHPHAHGPHGYNPHHMIHSHYPHLMPGTNKHVDGTACHHDIDSNDETTPKSTYGSGSVTSTVNNAGAREQGKDVSDINIRTVVCEVNQGGMKLEVLDQRRDGNTEQNQQFNQDSQQRVIVTEKQTGQIDSEDLGQQTQQQIFTDVNNRTQMIGSTRTEQSVQNQQFNQNTQQGVLVTHQNTDQIDYDDLGQQRQQQIFTNMNNNTPRTEGTQITQQPSSGDLFVRENSENLDSINAQNDLLLSFLQNAARNSTRTSANQEQNTFGARDNVAVNSGSSGQNQQHSSTSYIGIPTSTTYGSRGSTINSENQLSSSTNYAGITTPKSFTYGSHINSASQQSGQGWRQDQVSINRQIQSSNMQGSEKDLAQQFQSGDDFGQQTQQQIFNLNREEVIAGQGGATTPKNTATYGSFINSANQQNVQDVRTNENGSSNAHIQSSIVGDSEETGQQIQSFGQQSFNSNQGAMNTFESQSSSVMTSSENGMRHISQGQDQQNLNSNQGAINTFTSQGTRDISETSTTQHSGGSAHTLSVMGLDRNNENLQTSHGVVSTSGYGSGSTYSHMQSGSHLRGDQPLRNTENDEDGQKLRPVFEHSGVMSTSEQEKQGIVRNGGTYTSGSYGSSHSSSQHVNYGSQQLEHIFNEDTSDLGQQQVVEPAFGKPGVYSGTLHNAEVVDSQKVENIREDTQQVLVDVNSHIDEEKASVQALPGAEETKDTSEVEVTTEKPGFWKNFGNKVTNLAGKVRDKLG